MPAPASKQQIDQNVAGWEPLRPRNEDPAYVIGGDLEQRAEQAQGLREFADLMEARPDLPMLDRIPLTIYLHGTDEEQMAQLNYAARLMGQPVNDVLARQALFDLERKFGPVSYRIVAMLHREDERPPAGAAGAEDVPAQRPVPGAAGFVGCTITEPEGN